MDLAFYDYGETISARLMVQMRGQVRTQTRAQMRGARVDRRAPNRLAASGNRAQRAGRKAWLDSHSAARAGHFPSEKR
jgi:hypothetical protein